MSEIKDWRAYYRKLNTIYYAFLIVPFMLFVFKYFTSYSNDELNHDEIKKTVFSTNSLLFLILGLGSVLVLRIIYKRGLKLIVKQDKLEDRLEHFKPYFLKHALYMQFFALLVVIVYYLTENPILILLYGIILAISSMDRPAYLKLFRVLKFTKKDRDEFMGQFTEA